MTVHCYRCGVLTVVKGGGVGVHFARAMDSRPCSGSYQRPRYINYPFSFIGHENPKPIDMQDAYALSPRVE